MVDGAQLLPVLSRFPALDVLVLVLGDAVLDAWLAGASTRLCREAPVPVVDVTATEVVPGGAANAAANVAALGARAHFLSITGADTDGDDLRAALRRRGVADTDVLVDDHRRTTAKRRLVCGDQILARFDQRDPTPWSDAVLDTLGRRVLELAPACDVVLVCDYDDGVLCVRVRALLEGIRDRLRGPLVVDAHHLAPWRGCRPSAVTPSAEELPELLACDHRPGIPLLEQSSTRLLESTGADLVVTTLDADGTLLHRPGRPPHRTRPAQMPQHHTTGAGDTFSAAFAMALGAGADPVACAEIAQRAADVVVAQPGTTVCRVTQLAHRCTGGAPKAPLTVEQLAARVAQHRAAGQRIAFTNGCFDIMHAGHAAYLQEAAELADVLVVAVNSDASVRRLKGPGRPVLGEAERVRLLSALAAVDMVVLFEEDTPKRLIELVRPDVYVKGGDYTSEMLPEAPLVRRLGGEVRMVDYVEDHSTSLLIERIRVGTGARA
jgi:D-beta-D-heptose 7-phosphate kinase / D-beta-D-heptose 1-phosphate adenosyltransferase